MSGHQAEKTLPQMYSRAGALVFRSAHDDASARKECRRWVPGKYDWDHISSRRMAAYRLVLDGRPTAS